MEPFDVINLGTVVVDIPVKLPYKALDFETDLTTLDGLSITPGGDAANSSIVLSQLGAKVVLIAAVGDDAFGDMLLRQISNRGVNIHKIATKRGVNTSVSIVMINSDGERCFLCTKGNNDALSEEDLDYALLDTGARHINYSGFFIHPQLDRGGIAKILETAKKKGLTVSADTNSDLYGLGFQTIQSHLEYVDIFMPSYNEAKHLTNEEEPERMARFLVNKTGEKIVIIKLGTKGSYVYQKGKGRFVPAYRVKVEDTTGAGDNFVAGVIFAFLKGMDIGECVQFANAVAALKIQYVGATHPQVTLENVLSFMKSNKTI